MIARRRARRRGSVTLSVAVSLAVFLTLVYGVLDVILAVAYITGHQAAADNAASLLARGADLATVQARAADVTPLGSGITVQESACYASFSAYQNDIKQTCDTNSQIFIYAVHGEWDWLSPMLRAATGGPSLVLQIDVIHTNAE